MSRYSIEEFVRNTKQQDKGEGLFGNQPEWPGMVKSRSNGILSRPNQV
jgi:hypothetical protein